jgi:SAM-dependent MidA family methyltransferase
LGAGGGGVSFRETVIAEVRRRGKITFAEFMGWALYHPEHGYYSRADRIGRAGDFFTSVQVGDLYGRLLAEAFMQMWDHLGSGRFTLVELGAGDGSLAAQVLQALDEKGRGKSVSIYLVEQGLAAREAARRRLARFPKVHIVESLEEFEHTAGVDGCVYSNEFFDALPVHRVRWEGGRLRELFVVERDGALREEPGALSTPALAGYFEEQGVALTEGQTAEVCLALDGVVESLDRVLSRGFVLSVDYGEPSMDLYREERRDGTLRSFQKHAVGGDLFRDPGNQDLTAHVDFGRLAALGARRDLNPLVFASQGTFLLNAGERLLKDVVEKESKEDPAVARRVQQLVHPEALGGAFHVLVQGKNVGKPELPFGRVNRVHRLMPPSSVK